MSIVAALDKVLFFNASSKYSVLRMKTEDSSVPTEARSPYRYHDHLIRFTAVGIELPQTDTVKIEMDGEWKDGKYGLQLQVDHWQEIVPPTLEGVRNYLASGLLKGIGEKTADAIIEKFGVNALEILEHQPDRLLEIRGITKERLAEIKDAYAETSRMRVLMTLLAPFKVTPTTAQKIYAAFMQTEPVDPDDVYQSLAVRLIRAVNSYDPRKGYLEEYILSQLKREMVRIRSTQAVYGLTQAPANIGSTIVSLTIAAQRESYWETYIAV